MQSLQASVSNPRTTDSDAKAARERITRMGVGAAVLGALAYLVARTTLAALTPDASGWDPLLRIGALLLGPDNLPGAGELSFPTLLIALLILLGVACLYGSVLAPWLAVDSLRTALLRGALAGLVLYGLHYGLVAPYMFTWFTDARQLPTALSHLLFGLVTAYSLHHWRRSAARRQRAARRRLPTPGRVPGSCG